MAVAELVGIDLDGNTQGSGWQRIKEEHLGGSSKRSCAQRIHVVASSLRPVPPLFVRWWK